MKGKSSNIQQAQPGKTHSLVCSFFIHLFHNWPSFLLLVFLKTLSIVSNEHYMFSLFHYEQKRLSICGSPGPTAVTISSRYLYKKCELSRHRAAVIRMTSYSVDSVCGTPNEFHTTYNEVIN